jgi:hypothetical protein
MHIWQGAAHAFCRELDALTAYEVAQVVIEEITKLDVITSPYPLSAVNINRYDAPGGKMSVHCDTNPVSALLYLTDNPNDGATVFFKEREFRWEYLFEASENVVDYGKGRFAVRDNLAALKQARKEFTVTAIARASGLSRKEVTRISAGVVTPTKRTWAALIKGIAELRGRTRECR